MLGLAMHDSVLFKKIADTTTKVHSKKQGAAM